MTIIETYTLGLECDSTHWPSKPRTSIAAPTREQAYALLEYRTGWRVDERGRVKCPVCVRMGYEPPDLEKKDAH